MRYGSVCSGIEAASVAWHAPPLNWEPAWFAEIDPFASAVLAHRYPGVNNLGDFTTIPATAGPVDVLVGGTPCQSFSVAGLRGGMADARGNLALEFLRLADRLCPEWVVWENVPGVLSSNGGRDFGAFLGGLAELGYGWAYRVLDAQHFGVPQRRRRVFVVGHLGDWRRAVAVLFERASLSGDPPPSRAEGARVAGCVNASPGMRGWANDTDDLIANTLAAHTGLHDSCGQNFVPVALNFQAGGNQTRYGFDPDSGVANTLNVKREQAVAYIVNAAESCATQSHARPSEIARCLDSTGSFANAQGGTVIACDFRNMNETGDVAHSLQVGGHGASPSNHPHVAGGLGVRRLTPRECERLQGFPDDFTLIPVKPIRKPVDRVLAKWAAMDRLGWIDGKPWILSADGPRYRALGNSFAVPVMRWIGERIAKICTSSTSV